MSDLRKALERVLANFPDAPGLAGDEATGFEAVWHSPNASVGLRTYGKQVVVFIEEAEAEVTSVSAATELLSGIFEDRFVGVAALKDEALIRCYIAPADSIGAGLNSPTHVYQGSLATAVDEVRVRSWSGDVEGVAD